MNNNIETLPNGDFKIVYPGKTGPEQNNYSVVYWDLMLKTARSREFRSLAGALNFIALKINQTHLYINFGIKKL